MKAFIFYNPLAGQGSVLKELDVLGFVLDAECVFCDMTKPESYENDLFSLQGSDYIVVCGGDGTLNRFVNFTQDTALPYEILYYPAGVHNDFARDFGRFCGCNPIPVTKYLQNLPYIRMENREGRFLTGCVFVADKSHGWVKSGENSGKNAPKGVCVSVDRGLYYYDKVCFAAVLHGHHCLGGWIPDPSHYRTDPELSCVLIHDCGMILRKWLLWKLKKGWKISSRYLTVHKGKTISFRFSEPVTLYTDGEVQSGILEFSAGERI